MKFQAVFEAGGEMLMSVIQTIINSIWNKEVLPEQWKEYIIVPVHKKSDHTFCNNHRRM
jgi:hypothetical protein